MSRSTVLIVTNEQDVGADFLVWELGKRNIPVVRLNTERGPEWKLSLEPTAGWQISRDQQTLNSDDCLGVWWRRPEVPVLSLGASAAADTIGDQWRTFLTALATVLGPTWISKPARIRAAEDKALQLREAHQLGLQVPHTLWTNDVDAARNIVQRSEGRAVVKSVTTAWWEDDQGANFMYASQVALQDLPSASRLAQAPVAFQQPIVPKRDIRVTIIEDVVLTAVREAPSDELAEALDWRRAPQLPWVAYELPQDVVVGCRDLVGTFDLSFGAIDLALDNDGTHWFLELNPNGEWGWLQRIGLPIAEALADTLTSGAAIT